MKRTLTLTRWHKVAERINGALKEEHVRYVSAAAVPESEATWGRREAPRIALQLADAALLAELASKLAREQARAHALRDELF